MHPSIPTIVLGGTGYVAGELLRLLAGHPHLEVIGVMSESQAGQPISTTFPNLQDSFGQARFGTRAQMLDLIETGPLALFSAAPHGSSAELVAAFVHRAADSGCDLTVVDVSADFRFSDAGVYESIYGQSHGAEDLLSRFTSALPEHQPVTDRPHIGHPGCFATAMLLGAVPLVKLDILDGNLYANGITGSTGSGKTPTASTHHPQRHSNLFAYKALAHRHSPEVVSICESVTGIRPQLRFVPHSGPFARGIHMTLQAQIKHDWTEERVRGALTDFYADCPFVIVKDGSPRIKDVVGSNYCHIGVAVDGDSIVVLVVIDNLVKGAAGGAVQWMNRQLGLAETSGLLSPAIAWT
jgi:N-acetyl-gamma-glutamyl-phosphate reductase common form